MNRDNVTSILVEFFREEFAEDPAGVGDWFAQGGNDIDAFIGELNLMYPPNA